MLTIIIGIVLAIIFVLISIFYGKSEEFVKIMWSLAFLVVIAALMVGTILPINGCENWELVEETELITLSNDVASGGTGVVYVSLSAGNIYIYRYEIDSEFDTETSREYKIETLTGEDVEEIEDPNCEVPVIRVYQREAKRTVWTFACYAETKYVFYVPEGTISREIKLN